MDYIKAKITPSIRSLIAGYKRNLPAKGYARLFIRQNGTIGYICVAFPDSSIFLETINLSKKVSEDELLEKIFSKRLPYSAIVKHAAKCCSVSDIQFVLKS